MIIELLAPAGNLEKLKIAVSYGADAVYVAGQSFSLRQAANNFSFAELSKAIDFVHRSKRKIYITVNAFPHDSEMGELTEYLKQLNRLRPDALICSDLGVAKLVKQQTDLALHISTQASVLNSHHASIWKDLGARRIVAARELTIAEAASMKEQTGLEIEMFVHGAMCMSYSGHCFMSTYVASRDSNRGGCIQNCRYRYSEIDSDQEPCHLLSSKDLCGMPLLKDFVEAGIDAIKIEGRMKSNFYIASTVRSYANALSEIEETGGFNPEYWQAELHKIPHRGYTQGSLKQEANMESVYHQELTLGKEHKMVGTVIEIDPGNGRLALHVKNKLIPGDQIEIMPFRGDIIPLCVQSLTDVDNQELAVAQPHKVIWIPWQEGIEVNNVARMQSQ